jgi:hypothetical protein
MFNTLYKHIAIVHCFHNRHYESDPGPDMKFRLERGLAAAYRSAGGHKPDIGSLRADAFHALYRIDMAQNKIQSIVSSGWFATPGRRAHERQIRGKANKD